MKQDVHRRTAVVFLGGAVRLQKHYPVLLMDHHMKITRSNDGATRGEGFATDTFPHRQWRLCRKARRQERSKNGRHVLHDNQRHAEVWRQARQNPRQGVWPPVEAPIATSCMGASSWGRAGTVRTGPGALCFA